MNLFLTVKAVSLKNRITTQRAYPISLFMQRVLGGVFEVCFPVFIYYFLFEESVSNEFLLYTGTDDYVTYVILGQSTSVVAFSTLAGVGRCMISEIREGTLENFLLSPASRIGYFIGAYIEQMVRSIFEFFVVLVVGFLLGAYIGIEKMGTMIFFIIILSLACFSMSVLISTIMVFTRDTYIVQNTFNIGVNFICGIFFPVEFLPNCLQILSKFFPITHALKAFRNCVLLEQPILDNALLLVRTLVWSVFMMAVGYYSYRKLEKKLIENIYS